MSNGSGWTIIYTSFKEYIHYEHLKKYNPNAQIMLCDISHNLTRDQAWRNSDRFIRNWLKRNIDKIENERIMLIEWDVFINTPLPDIKFQGLMSKVVITPNSEPTWVWFREKNKLGNLIPFASGVVPLAFLVMDKEVCKTLINPKFDYLFDQDIFCELRFSTVLRSENIPISQMSFPIPHISLYKNFSNLDKPDFYHPVKESIIVQ
jgi:hypothetical protein